MSEDYPQKKKGEKYVVFKEEWGDEPSEGFFEAHITNGGHTLCGRSIEGEYRTGNDVGPIPVCGGCEIRDPGQTNKELMDSLAQLIPELELDSGGPPSYLNKSQLAAIHRYVVESLDGAASVKEETDGA